MPFLIPIAGLALGALGRLIGKKRSARALENATAASGAPTPSETSLSTAASSSTSVQQEPQQSYSELSKKPPTALKPHETQTAQQPATGPVQQNRGVDSPTPAPGDNAGLVARLGREAKTRSRKRNKEQQARVSNAALS